MREARQACGFVVPRHPSILTTWHPPLGFSPALIAAANHLLGPSKILFDASIKRTIILHTLIMPRERSQPCAGSSRRTLKARVLRNITRQRVQSHKKQASAPRALMQNCGNGTTIPLAVQTASGNSTTIPLSKQLGEIAPVTVAATRTTVLHAPESNAGLQDKNFQSAHLNRTTARRTKCRFAREL